MGDLVSFPFGGVCLGGAPDRAQAVPVQSWPETVALWVELLDDLKARHVSLTSREERIIWCADVDRLCAELARQPVNIRMASDVATRLIALKISFDTERPQYAGKAPIGRIGDGLMADARAENERLKGLIFNREGFLADEGKYAAAAVALDLIAANITGDGTPSIAPAAYPAAVPRRAERIGQRLAALGLEACSVRYHFHNLCVALLAFLRLGWHWLLAHLVMDDPFAPWVNDAASQSAVVQSPSSRARRPLLVDEARMSHVREGVMRKDADDYLYHDDDLPTGAA